MEDGDGGEGAAVAGGGAETAQGGEVGGGAVAFVFGEAVAGELRVEFQAETVTRDLGEDGGAGDEKAAGVAFDEGGVGDRQAFDGESVHECVVGQRGESFERTAHGQMGGAKDVDGIDFLGRGLADGPADAGFVGQRLIERIALGGGKLLGIVGLGQGPGEQGGEVGLVNLHGTGDDGPGKAPAPGLVHPGERGAGMGGPEVVFGPEVGTHTSVAVRS